MFVSKRAMLFFHLSFRQSVVVLYGTPSLMRIIANSAICIASLMPERGLAELGRFPFSTILACIKATSNCVSRPAPV